jgi:hypothetical protein
MLYALKEGMEQGEPPHQLCTECYSRGKKSLLQREVRTPGMARVEVCHSCGSEYYVSGIRQPEHSKPSAAALALLRLLLQCGLRLDRFASRSPHLHVLMRLGRLTYQRAHDAFRFVQFILRGARHV